MKTSSKKMTPESIMKNMNGKGAMKKSKKVVKVKKTKTAKKA